MSFVDSAQHENVSNRTAHWKWGLRLAFFTSLILLWEWFGRARGGLLIAPFSKTLASWVELVMSSEFYAALWLSNQALLIGFAGAVLVGIPLGLLLGRMRPLERFVDLYLNVLIVMPMAALIPLIIVAVGLNLTARVLVVFMFAFPIMTVNTRTGLKNLDRTLVDMTRAFGATEIQLWHRILLPGAAPAIMTGVRLGLGRALSGMVVVELLLIAVGLGKLILNATGLFEPERVYAVIIAIILEVLVLMGIARRLEMRLLAWRSEF